MRKYIATLLIITTMGLIACKREKDKSMDEIKKLEAALFGDKNAMNDSLANLYTIKTYEYSKAYPDDINTPELLYKSGEVFSGIANNTQAIKRFQDVYLKYPEFNKAAESMFLCGFIYENLIGNTEEATYYYKLFLKKYPTHTLAKDAKTSLENMGKTPEQLIEEFEKKNKTS